MDSLKLKERVIEAKRNLPKSGITSLYFHYFDVKDNSKNRSELNNVLQLRKASEEITENLETLVELLDNKNK